MRSLILTAFLSALSFNTLASSITCTSDQLDIGEPTGIPDMTNGGLTGMDSKYFQVKTTVNNAQDPDKVELTVRYSINQKMVYSEVFKASKLEQTRNKNYVNLKYVSTSNTRVFHLRIPVSALTSSDEGYSMAYFQMWEPELVYSDTLTVYCK